MTAQMMPDIDCVLFDLDGVVYAGPQAVPGAVAGISALRGAGFTVGFVTNNASRTRTEVAEHLTELGIPAQKREVISSAQVAATAVATEYGAGSAVVLIGGAGLQEEIAAAQLVAFDSLAAATRAGQQPVAVVQGMTRAMDYQRIIDACVAVRAGLPWWATNLDFSMPTEQGLLPGNGAFVDMIAGLTGTRPQSTGKPAAHMMHTAAQALNARRPLVVGDRLDTDIAGGRAAGFLTALVLTGVHDLHDAAHSEHRPDRIITQLCELNTPWPLIHLHTPEAGHVPQEDHTPQEDHVPQADHAAQTQPQSPPLNQPGPSKHLPTSASTTDGELLAEIVDKTVRLATLSSVAATAALQLIWAHADAGNTLALDQLPRRLPSPPAHTQPAHTQPAQPQPHPPTTTEEPPR